MLLGKGTPMSTRQFARLLYSIDKTRIVFFSVIPGSNYISTVGQNARLDSLWYIPVYQHDSNLVPARQGPLHPSFAKLRQIGHCERALQKCPSGSLACRSECANSRWTNERRPGRLLPARGSA